MAIWASAKKDTEGRTPVATNRWKRQSDEVASEFDLVRSRELRMITVEIHDTVSSRPSSLLSLLRSAHQGVQRIVQRTITAGSETYLEDIYTDEPSCEVIFRKLVNGVETDTERVVAPRTHPLGSLNSTKERYRCFRVHWDMPSRSLGMRSR